MVNDADAVNTQVFLWFTLLPFIRSYHHHGGNRLGVENQFLQYSFSFDVWQSIIDIKSDGLGCLCMAKERLVSQV